MKAVGHLDTELVMTWQGVTGLGGQVFTSPVVGNQLHHVGIRSKLVADTNQLLHTKAKRTNSRVASRLRGA